MKKIFLISCLTIFPLYACNQTPDTTPVLVNQPLPFSITIKQADFSLPEGLQSASSATHGCEYLFIGGRTNGMHHFDNAVPNSNFPIKKQNTTLFVVNPVEKTVKTRSLLDPMSGLTVEQIETLAVTAAQSYQCENTLYITGGYGYDSETKTFSTKSMLTAIDVAGLIRWVKNPEGFTFAAQYIRQIADPIFQVTGGDMNQYGDNPTLLMLGQNFKGYYTPASNGEYTQQTRRFRILDDGKDLKVKIEKPTKQYSNFRRRDLNIVPLIEAKDFTKSASFVALSGVFTPDENLPGIWTVPIEIAPNGEMCMANPKDPKTFKQGMNNYNSAKVVLFGNHHSNYIVLFGGITYGFFKDGEFLTDSEFPFTDEVTVVERTKKGEYKQYYLGSLYPTIPSVNPHPGNPLLFGATAKFMVAHGVSTYSNGVLNLERIKKPTVIGYIIGGIQSTVPNTVEPDDSSASAYIFEVTLTPHENK